MFEKFGGGVLMTEVSGGWVRGRPRLGRLAGWCVDSLGQRANDGGGCVTR